MVQRTPSSARTQHCPATFDQLSRHHAPPTDMPSVHAARQRRASAVGMPQRVRTCAAGRRLGKVAVEKVATKGKVTRVSYSLDG
jgi:hypothetical protein